jgi:hypothetical protein
VARWSSNGGDAMVEGELGGGGTQAQGEGKRAVEGAVRSGGVAFFYRGKKGCGEAMAGGVKEVKNVIVNDSCYRVWRGRGVGAHKTLISCAKILSKCMK